MNLPAYPSRPVIYFVAASLDGFIARPSGMIDWLFSDQDYGYQDFYATVDTLLIGRRTFDQMLGFGETSFPNRRAYVFTRQPKPSLEPTVTFTAKPPEQLIPRLQAQPGKHLWLVGGAGLAQPCFAHHLVDRLVISLHPRLLGGGIPLFPLPFPETTLELQACQSFDSGLVQLTYTVGR